MSRERLILVAPSGLERMYGDGRRKGKAGTYTTGGAIRTAGMSAIGKVLERYSSTQRISHSRRNSEGTRSPPVQKTFIDRERVRDSRHNYQVRTVSGAWETAMAELTKQVGGLIQGVRGIKTRLDSIDSRLSKVEAWEGRLGAVEQQLR